MDLPCGKIREYDVWSRCDEIRGEDPNPRILQSLISLRRLDASGRDALNRAAGANGLAIDFGHGFTMIIASVVSLMQEARNDDFDCRNVTSNTPRPHCPGIHPNVSTPLPREPIGHEPNLSLHRHGPNLGGLEKKRTGQKPTRAVLSTFDDSRACGLVHGNPVS